MAERLALIDYGSGNLRSVAKALERAARDAGVDIAIDITGDAKTIARADSIILPGVGAFGHCANALRALPDVWDVLHQSVMKNATPFLGICVGMQLLATRGLEHGDHAGLNWIAGDVVKLAPTDARLKIPHMGWNTLRVQLNHKILYGLSSDSHAYFVHSYQFKTSTDVVCLSVDYGGEIAAMIAKDNIIGTQFHPEKSQSFGLQFLQNFLMWKP